jgi:hypothetical protein
LAFPRPAAAAGAAEAGDWEAVAYASASQGYSLRRPAGWEAVDKPGADALFQDPQRKSTNAGVTVLPVMIDSLQQFGSLEEAGARLLAQERQKESTLGVGMVAAAVRPAAAGPVYDFEYELESTRGRKRIVSSVAIAGGKLYVVNGQASCGKGATCDAAEADIQTLRRIAQSFEVKAPA